MKILFVLNGGYNKRLESFLNDYNIVVAVDGGLNHLKNFTPHYAIGDSDSIDKKLLENINSNIIFKDNQDESDFLFAVECETNSSSLCSDKVFEEEDLSLISDTDECSFCPYIKDDDDLALSL